MEREFIQERTRVAIATLKAQGKHVGRPLKWSEATRRHVIDLVRRGITLRETCKLVGVGYRSALKYLPRDPEYLKARLRS
jgi:DNA invertase Pin-like site-specific DNA recombinase